MNFVKIIIAIVVLTIVVFTSCTLYADNCSEKKPLIGFSMDTLNEERWLSDKAFFTKRVQELGGMPIVTVARNNDDVQIKQIKELINQGVETIVIIPHNSEKLEPVIKEAHQAGIKVISYGRLIGSDVDFHVAFNAFQIGELEAKGVSDVLKNGKIAYLGGAPTDNNSVLLKQGTMNFLKTRIEKGEIEIVFDEFIEEWDPETAYKKLGSYLQDHEIDGVIAANDGLARGAIKALGEANLKNVPVSGGDADLESCRYIVEEKQVSTVYMPIKKMADKAAEIAVQKNTSSSIKSFLIDSVFVNKQNMNESVIEVGFHSYDEVYAKIPHFFSFKRL